MNVPLPPPSEEPMLYFLSNSLAVVGAAGVLFFILGLWFGYLTWGRFKRRSRAFQEETSLLLHEIATLKRRIAEEAVEPSRPVSINDEGPSVELQPLLFPLGPQVASAPVPEKELEKEPALESPLAAVVAAVSSSSILANDKAAPYVPTSLPDSVGGDLESVSAPAVPRVAEVLPPPAQSAPTETVVAPIQEDQPTVTPIPSVKAESLTEAAGPVVALALPGGAFPAQLLPDMLGSAREEGPTTSQMSATFQVSHDAGTLDLPTLPSFESLAVTLSSSSSSFEQVPAPAAIEPVTPSLAVQETLVPSTMAELAETPLPSPIAVPVSTINVPDAPVPQNPAQWFSTELDQALGIWDPQMGFCYTHRPERWDDLTLLRGLAEPLQERLHDYGIFTFKQIALWSDAHSIEVGQRLQSSERIVRDRWVHQARDLHFLKYGERLG